ncbi:beta-ketoacyl synthase N-terminal-like domain-containing protein [Brevundimonas sp. M20]|uniref:beta-ketoacyl synthase N-terminal-like domain-containing protein n=1 Tax=Brevundimonas sp. M20 TaxID=2591463 RepID=UPI0011467F62|nr:beta-ketoacyl synthase N-terminal-like domain-containing protein [Brevundimonas sp. M20]QDH73996.1 beta-ketoacyl synthase [Brevundimonas sp. M20]
MSRSYFVGAGLHTCLGQDVAANVAALFAPPPDAASVPLEAGGLRAVVPALLLKDRPLVDIENRLESVLEAVCAEAIEAAGLTAAERADTILLLGSSSVDISRSEAIYQRELAEGLDAHPLTHNNNLGRLAERLRRRFGLGGPDYTVSTACTASANALIYGDALIRSGRAGHALVVSSESLNIITAMGFQGLNLLSKTGTMKPFDSARGGLVPGEGCGAVVVSGGKRRGNGAGALASSGFHLRGAANLCDIFGMSAANPDGSTVLEVIQRALDSAGVEAGRIAGIKTHGTASLLNDEAEAAGMARAFGTVPPLCALKPFIGHTFGACGLNELILFCALLEQGYFPAVPGVCAEPGELGISLFQTPQPMAPGVFMLNYFGFGGNNTSLVIANVDD